MANERITSDIDFDRSVIGVEVDVGTYRVTAEEIVAYARAIGETNPLYLDEEAAIAGPHGALIAPPLFVHTLRLQPGGPDPTAHFGTTSFTAGQRTQHFEPIRAGDTITATSQITDVYAKTGRTGTMVFLVRRVTYRNQHGHTVMTMDNSMVRRDMRQ